MALLAAPLLMACGSPPRPDVLIVTLDTTRADALGVYGGPAGATPTLDRLAAEGARFDEALSPAPLTLPAHAALWTGRYPDALGLRGNGRAGLATTETTLAERLAAEGYLCYAHVAAIVLDSAFGLNQGFNLYDDEMSQSPHSTAMAQRSGEAVVGAALATLQLSRGQDAPMLLWVHLFDAHEPRTPAPALAARFPDDLYEAEVAGLDGLVGRLIDAFTAARPDRPRLVVVAGDHGESLGEHGEDTHGYFAYRSTLRVPLLMAGAGVPAGAVVNAPVSLVDVAPTVLEALGLPAPPGLDGLSLLPLVRGEVADRGAVYGHSLTPRDLFGLGEIHTLQRPDGWRLIDAPRPELYAWRDDPAESVDRSQEQATRLASLKSELDALRGRSASASTAEVSAPDVLAGLSALGYLTTLDPAPVPAAGLKDPKDGSEMARLYFQLLGGLPTLGPARAAASLEAFLERWPEVDAAVPMLVGAWLSLGHGSQAERVTTALRARRPGDPGVELLVGAVALSRGRLEDAERALSAADTPGLRWRQLPLMAALRRAQGRCEEALKLVEQAERLGGLDSTAPLVRGACELEEGDPGAAEASLRRALVLDPDSRDAHYLLGLALARLGRVDEALEQLQIQAARTPDDPKVEAALGRALVVLERFDEGIAHLRPVVMDPSASTDAPLLLALALWRTGGDTDEVLRLLDEADRRTPGNPEVARLRASAKLSARDVDGALESLQGSRRQVR